MTKEDKTAKVVSLDKAYTKPQEKVLDPTKIDQSSLERLPVPSGWRILILPYRGKGKTEGGVLLLIRIRRSSPKARGARKKIG